MLNLYYKPTCKFSRRVIGEAEILGLTINLKNISADEAVRHELIEKGGKKQTPFLEDTERGVRMYESGDIIAYLAAHAPQSQLKNVAANLRIYRSDAVCDVSE